MFLDWGVPAVTALLGALVCYGTARIAITRADERVMRINVHGRAVPAVLGWPILVGSLVGLLALFWWSEWSSAAGLDWGYRFFPNPIFGAGLRWIHPVLIASIAVLLVGLYEAGWWDDLRGDERPRGFAGHLAAARGGAITGGVVKLVIGGIVGVVVAAMTLGGFHWLRLFVPIALVIPLSANLVNLLDRAPGRALKIFLGLAVPIAVLGDPLWRTLAAATIGAALVAALFDLKAHAMLGDAGANPLGGLLGLGLAVNLGGSVVALWILVLVLLTLNLASEKWSFSEIIARNRVLARLDQLGRE